VADVERAAAERHPAVHDERGDHAGPAGAEGQGHERHPEPRERDHRADREARVDLHLARLRAADLPGQPHGPEPLREQPGHPEDPERGGTCFKKVFDHSKNKLTSKQVQELKQNFANDFKEIFDLCYQIARTYVQNPSLIRPGLMKACLETLFAFLSWIPLHYIFEIDLMENVLTPLIKNVQFCNLAIDCLTEVRA